LYFKVLFDKSTTMTLQQHLKHTFKSRSLVRNMLTGAIIGLMLIGFFLYNADAPDPEWPRFWIIRPLLLVPFAGAMGGLFYTFMEPWRNKNGWIKAAAYFLCLIVVLIGLFMGTVLGLDGTYWD